MAMDLFSIPAMSSDVERLFSSAGSMVSLRRGRLEANTIAMCQSIRSWQREGIIQLQTNNILMYSEPPSSQEQRCESLQASGLGLPESLVERDAQKRVVRPADD